MSQVVERFLRYVAFDTQSSEDGTTVPSTEKQFALARCLYQELTEMGVPEVRLDEEHGYVYAKLPSNLLTRSYVPPIGLIAHMDTSPAVSGAGVSPRRVSNYDGKDIVLSEKVVLSVAENPELLSYVGQDLLVTDGRTLLGADDKAGIAEIMETAAYFLQHPEVRHGDICIAFTPDEEIGRGVDYFDVKGFGAAFAYTVDGGAIGEIEYENFNALNIELQIRGRSVHPGDAKGKMKNALLIGMEFQQLLPAFENPAYTEGYEGFYHLDSMEGSVEFATMNYIIRDHDAEAFEKKVAFIEDAMKFINKKYGPDTVMYIETASYRNMREMIEPHMFLIDQAKEAMESVGIAPKVVPIRGGTDGARLSFMGLPCPNLCAGGHNFHGKLEYIPVPSLEKITDFLIALLRSFAPQA